ncbi:unnamed protein product [marine sediment metagenome]|uniref:Ribbon-helix-helix protein CopG domain-containing protein n=1 Tax=marine sediment metagenome TaxID=412755 RepID=X1LZV4_9ZZZZ
MGTFSLDVPDSLLKQFDKRIKGRYKTRSEAIRVAMSLLIDQLNNDDLKAAQLDNLEKTMEEMKEKVGNA